MSFGVHRGLVSLAVDRGLVRLLSQVVGEHHEELGPKEKRCKVDANDQAREILVYAEVRYFSTSKLYIVDIVVPESE